MSTPVILTCAVTGGADVAQKYPQLPVTPEEIASECIAAARAGAAIVHIHVRDPETGKPSMELAYYKEVMDRIRRSNTDVLINLTTGPGARFVPDLEVANQGGQGSSVRPVAERVRHVIELKPDICSLDMGSVNFGAGALINTPAQIKVIAQGIRSAGVKAELEIFDSGHVALASQFLKDEVLDPNPLFQFALGIPWGAPATTETMVLLRQLLPHDALWAAFGIGRFEFPMVAQAVLLGGHVRVGLEDNFFLQKGVQANSNAELVEKARQIVCVLGKDLATPSQARELLGLAVR